MRSLLLVLWLTATCSSPLLAVDALQQLDTHVLNADEREQYDGMIARDIERRRLLAISRENKAWADVNTREDWEAYRDVRLGALRKSLGAPIKPGQIESASITRRIQGDGFQIQNLVFESHPGLFVTSNLYLPSPPRSKRMPAILISHSHHAPKTQGELQDMGMTWARHGAIVLVLDHLGHGERRQHPFVASDDYEGSFRLSRQDYYFRYNTGLQLQLVGESLIGWMARDLVRGVDLLSARDDVDPDRLILIGAVAGGGDPAGVAAALDPRIDAVAPFNFGGPQPDYSIPTNAEDAFYYFGVAHWETTRSLRLGGRDGFAHWMIVGSVAPRRLIYSHEFGWERDRDPVWPRLQKVFGLYDSEDHLDVATGRGHLKGRPPENTHCGNVGVFHRRKFYPHLQRWFDMEPPAAEHQQRLQAHELACLAGGNQSRVYELAAKIGASRALAARQRFRAQGARQALRDAWEERLGKIDPGDGPTVLRVKHSLHKGLAIEHILLEVEDGIVAPVLMLRDAKRTSSETPIVLMFARAGKDDLVTERSAAIAELIEGGATVCLFDLRGTGETNVGDALDRGSRNTTLSCRAQVLGQTLLGSRLLDLRSVLHYVRGRRDLKGPIALWGDSLAAANPASNRFTVPLGIDNPNVFAEPSGGLLAMLGALFEEDVSAVYASGTFATFQSMLQSPFLLAPHDAIVPGSLTTGDVADLAAAIAPRGLRVGNSIDGLNRQVSDKDVQSAWKFASAGQHDLNLRLSISSDSEAAAAWVLSQLARK